MVRLECLANIYYCFIKELYDALSEDGVSKNVTFITREGPFLKRLFEYYQTSLPAASVRHKTAYMECSRNAVLSACKEDLCELLPLIGRDRFLHAAGLTSEEIRTILQLDATGQDAYIRQVTAQSEASLRRYMSSFCEDGRMNIADLGGRGYIQDKLTKHFDVQVDGYYLSFRSDGGVSTEHKRALVYIASKQLGLFSKYAHIFLSINFVLEELAMTGDGSVLRFAFDGDGNPIRIKEWAPAQQSFYEQWVSDLQPELESLICRLIDTCHMNRTRLLRTCAWGALRFAMLKNSEEMEMMRNLEYGDETVLPGYALQDSRKSFRDFPWSFKIFTAPDEYVHFFYRLQDLMWRRWWGRPLYLLIAGVYFIYTWVIVSFAP